MPQLLGRELWLRRIAAFATGQSPYQWLVGGAYAGKTALLYEAVTVGLPDEVDVICYFLSRRGSDADSSRFLAAVVPQLAYLCDVDSPTPDRDQFHTLWRLAAEQTAAANRHLLLVVDGLDEDLNPDGLPSVAHLLPTIERGDYADHAHVLVASRPRPELPTEVPDWHPLRVARGGALELEPFDGAQELADHARQEIYELTHGAQTDDAVEVLGLLTAAAGPLSVDEIGTLCSPDFAKPSAARVRRARRVVEERAARSLEPVDASDRGRYQFAHYSLLQYAQATVDLRDSEYRDRIHRWADTWQKSGWVDTESDSGPPLYLLGSYPATIKDEPGRMSGLVGDFGWLSATIEILGVDQALTSLRTAAAMDPRLSQILALVTASAHNLRPPRPLDEAGYVLRHLCHHALERGQLDLADRARERLLARTGNDLTPIWTSRRTSQALAIELGSHVGDVGTVAVLADGRVVSGGLDGRIQLWDPAAPGATPVEFGTTNTEYGPSPCSATGVS